MSKLSICKAKRLPLHKPTAGFGDGILENQVSGEKGGKIEKKNEGSINFFFYRIWIYFRTQKKWKDSISNLNVARWLYIRLQFVQIVPPVLLACCVPMLDAIQK